MLEEEKHRVNQLLSGSDILGQPLDPVGKMDEKSDEWKRQQADREKRRVIQEEIEALDQEMELLSAEEQLLASKQSSATADTTSPSSPKKKPDSSSQQTTLGNGPRLKYHKTW